MIDVSGGYLGNPAFETAGFKMIDVSRALILSTKFRTARTNFEILGQNTVEFVNKMDF